MRSLSRRVELLMNDVAELELFHAIVLFTLEALFITTRPLTDKPVPPTGWVQGCVVGGVEGKYLRRRW